MEKLKISPYAIPDVNRRMRRNNLLDKACAHFNVNMDTLVGKSRKKDGYIARCAVFFYYKHTTTLSLEEIGSKCNRDHATVHAGLKKFNDNLNYFEEFREKILSFFSEIGALDELSNHFDLIDNERIKNRDNI